MNKKVTKEFYKKGTLSTKGNKIILKTRPVYDNIWIDKDDPITSFHSTLINMKSIITKLNVVKSIPGIKDAVPTLFELSNEDLIRIQILLDYLIQSPISIIKKDNELIEESSSHLKATNMGVWTYSMAKPWDTSCLTVSTGGNYDGFRISI